ncbi:valine-tRNA ligase [Wolffia australiana]
MSSPISEFPDDAAGDLISAEDRKDEALAVLKSEVMAALEAEVKTLDRDSWMFSAPRSQIHLISRPGAVPRKKLGD